MAPFLFDKHMIKVYNGFYDDNNQPIMKFHSTWEITHGYKGRSKFYKR